MNTSLLKNEQFSSNKKYVMFLVFLIIFCILYSKIKERAKLAYGIFKK